MARIGRCKDNSRLLQVLRLTHQLFKRYLDLIEQQIVCHITHLQLYVLIDEAEFEGEANTFCDDFWCRR